MTPPPHSVMLLYGTGSKAQHNGKSAQLGKRSGSWTTATIHGSLSNGATAIGKMLRRKMTRQLPLSISL